MGGFVKNKLAAKRGYTYRLTRRQFLVASSAAALAACAPGAVTPGASSTVAPGKALKIGLLLPFSGVYAELGTSMRRATEFYLKQHDNRLANRPVTTVYADDANVTATGIAAAQKFIDQDQVDVMMGVVAPPLGNADFAPFVTQIKNQPTKNVYSFFSGADAIGFIKSWNSLGLPAAGYKMYGAGFLTEQDVLKEVKDLANGAITSLFWAVELDNAENKKFVADFQKSYPLLPDVFAVQQYDGMRALDEALKKLGGDTSDKDKLVKALEDVTFKSPRGDFAFDKSTHNPIQDIYIREVKTQNGQTVNTITDKIAKVTDPGK